MIKFTILVIQFILAATIVAQTTNSTSFALSTTSKVTGFNTCAPKFYPRPSSIDTKDSFIVNIRSSGSNWTTLDNYLIGLNLINTTSGSSIHQQSSLAYFDSCGSVDVSIQYTQDIISTAVIRPLSYGIVPVITNDTLTFTLNEPQDIIIEVNDDIFDCMHLLMGAVDEKAPTTNDTNLLYFGPGVHSIDGGILNVSSGQTVYLAGGAVLSSTTINFMNVSNAAVRGSGMISNPPNGVVRVENSQDIFIQGLIMINGGVNIATSEAVTVQGIRSFSDQGWGDGIDVFSSKDVLVDGVFMRNSDDCIAIYCHRNNWYGNTTNITVQNSALWADVAHPLNVGTHGNPDDPEIIEGLRFTNIDIMDQREKQVDYQGCIALNPGDGNLVKDVFIEDIRVENIRLGQLINMRVAFNTKYNTAPGRGITNVTVKDLSYNGTNAGISILTGYDETRNISFVAFQNLTINGLHISDSMTKPTWYATTDFIPMYANEHVHNLTFTT